MKLDLLAIGAHPDDVELGCGGTLIKHKKLGFKTGIIDLTRGELGTRGNISKRQKESNSASEILDVDIRSNLELEDGFFENNKNNQIKLITLIRKYKPTIVLCNPNIDRHPDHGRSSSLVYNSCFLSGLRKIKTNEKPWRPKMLLHYVQFNLEVPSLIVDISNEIDDKMSAILAYKSQFYDANSKEPETIISKKSFLDGVKYRASNFGRIINVEYGEGFITNRPIGINNLSHLF